MGGDKLREFDIDLGQYLLGQLRPCLRELPARPLPGHFAAEQDRLRHVERALLDMPSWVGRVVAALPPALADHLWAGVAGEEIERCLTDRELAWLAFAFDDPPERLEGRCVWTPYPALHRRAVECVPEIISGLTKQTAEEWVGDSAGFAAKLCKDGLSLADGIATVRDWLLCARRLLTAMGAEPSPPSPGNRTTPTRSNAGRTRTRRDDPRSGNEDSRRGADAGEEQTPEMLSPAGIDAKYSISRSTVYAACRAGMLPHYRVPAKKGARGKYLVKEVDLLAWLETLKSAGETITPSASAPASSRSAPVEPFSELDPRRLARAWKD